MLSLIFLSLYLTSNPPDWLTDSARPVFVAQAIIGTIALIGLVAIIRRFLSVEFPAAMKAVNDRLDTLHSDFKSLERDFQGSMRDLERLKERVDQLDRRQNTLDDTASRMRRRQPPHPQEGR